MPTILETPRLIIRPFKEDDLLVIHRILDQAFGDGTLVDDQAELEQRRSWLEWSMLNQTWLPNMGQPPYGDRAIVEKGSQALIGSVGYVPCLAPFDQILCTAAEASGFATPELGLFWVIDSAWQRRGYAAEAAQVMVEHAFKQLRLKRIIATTEYSNSASQGVMRKLGMQILHNPLPEPPWLQVVGLLPNPEAPGS